MKVRVSEAVGPVLDWMVAKCESEYGLDDADRFLRDHRIGFTTRYSTTWSQAGPIIEREFITLTGWRSPQRDVRVAGIETATRSFTCMGPTSLIAAMRCYVASKLGDEVEVPEKLMS